MTKNFYYNLNRKTLLFCLNKRLKINKNINSKNLKNTLRYNICLLKLILRYLKVFNKNKQFFKNNLQIQLSFIKLIKTYNYLKSYIIHHKTYKNNIKLYNKHFNIIFHKSEKIMKLLIFNKNQFNVQLLNKLGYKRFNVTLNKHKSLQKYTKYIDIKRYFEDKIRESYLILKYMPNFMIDYFQNNKNKSISYINNDIQQIYQLYYDILFKTYIYMNIYNIYKIRKSMIYNLNIDEVICYEYYNDKEDKQLLYDKNIFNRNDFICCNNYHSNNLYYSKDHIININETTLNYILNNHYYDIIYYNVYLKYYYLITYGTYSINNIHNYIIFYNYKKFFKYIEELNKEKEQDLIDMDLYDEKLYKYFKIFEKDDLYNNFEDIYDNLKFERLKNKLLPIIEENYIYYDPNNEKYIYNNPRLFYNIKKELIDIYKIFKNDTIEILDYVLKSKIKGNPDKIQEFLYNFYNDKYENYILKVINYFNFKSLKVTPNNFNSFNKSFENLIWLFITRKINKPFTKDYDTHDFILFLKYSIKSKQFITYNLLFNLLKEKILNKEIPEEDINDIIYYLIQSNIKDKALELINNYYKVNNDKNNETDINVKSGLSDNNPNLNHTLLYAAIKSNYTDIVKILLNQQYKYKFSKTNFNGSLLQLALNNKNQEICKLLIEHGHPYNYPKVSFKDTALCCALKNKLYDTVKLLIDNDVRLNYQHNPFKNTPLSYALHTKNESIIEKIINKGVKVDYPNVPFKLTPLYKSIVYKLNKTSILLINKGVKINYKKVNFEYTPLYFSIKNELEDVSLLLINKGVKIHYRNITDDKKTVLGTAEYYGPPSVVNALIEKGCLNDLNYVIKHTKY